MPETLTLGSLIEIGRTYLGMRVGGAELGPLDTCIVVAALSVALFSAINLWRIGRREDFGDRLDLLRNFARARAQAERSRGPSWYDRLAAGIAATPIIGATEQRTLLSALAAAGLRGQSGLAALITGKVCCSVLFVVLGWLLFEWRGFFAGSTTLRLICLVGAAFFGWRMPEVVLARLAARRKVQLERGMPDALDLLVVCAEAGLSLDQAIEQVGHDLRSSNREVAEEFATTADEMRVLPDRAQALENLAHRAGLTSLRSIVATLVQAIRFGTPLAHSLRVLAAEMRSERLARFEERAARLPVLLTIPLMAFILPSLMIVIGTPLVLRMLDFLEQTLGGSASVGGKLLGGP
jgi:tight adherence protein C